MTTAVSVHELVKRYPKRPSNAVDSLSFEVDEGEIFGLLGPNGAGKSTTIGILTTRVVASSGHAEVAGVDVIADPVLARARLAVVPQRVNLDRALTARQNLLFHAAYHGVSKPQRQRRATELLEQFGLGDRGNDKVDRYSGGQAQRLMIARALMHRPSVLFLDEPSTGLDPQARLFVWDRIRELQGQGVTIVLTTHDMDEAAQLCARVGIVDHGRMLALDRPSELVRALPGKNSIDVTLRAGADVSAQLSALAGVSRVETVEHSAERTVLRSYVNGDSAELLAALVTCVNVDGRLLDISIGNPSLEDVFISLTGRGLR